MSAPLAGRTVLVVDDRAEMIEVLSDVLAHAGALVVSARGGQRALARIRERAIDVVISDLEMPGMSGLELVRAIRALPGDKKDVLTIALTGATPWDLADPFAAASAGFDYHLLKPVMPTTLVELLVTLLRHRPKRGSGKHPRFDADIPRAAAARRQQR